MHDDGGARAWVPYSPNGGPVPVPGLRWRVEERRDSVVVFLVRGTDDDVIAVRSICKYSWLLARKLSPERMTKAIRDAKARMLVEHRRDEASLREFSDVVDGECGYVT